MNFLKSVGRKIQVGIEKIDGPDPIIPCEVCNKMMYNATNHCANWVCDYCQGKFAYKDEYYRLRCQEHEKNVCRKCARNIEDTSKKMIKYPMFCGVCNYQLQDATKLRQPWVCQICKYNYKSTATAIRFRCYVHNYDICYECAYSKYDGLEAQKLKQQGKFVSPSSTGICQPNPQSQQYMYPQQQNNSQWVPQQQQFNQPPMNQNYQNQNQQQFNQPPQQSYNQQQSYINQPPQQQYQNQNQNYNQFNQPPQQQNQFNQNLSQNQSQYVQQQPQQGNNQQLTDEQMQQLQAQQYQQQQQSQQQDQQQQQEQPNYNYPTFE